MTTAERKWKRRQKLARDLDKLIRQSGCSQIQISKYTGVPTCTIHDCLQVNREPTEAVYKKLYMAINDQKAFSEWLNQFRKYCEGCGKDLGIQPNKRFCPTCREKHDKEVRAAYRQRKRLERAENKIEGTQDRAKKLAEKRMFKGMSENMRKISAIEVEARKHDWCYGRQAAIHDGRL